jgi:signal peptidase
MWSFLSPSQVGGPVTLVIASGNSMEPAIAQGDLLALRRTTDHRVNDIVGYRSERTGQLVLHRIVGLDDGRFVLQGDNNYWLDPDRPDESEIVGKSWVHLPGVGQALVRLRDPVAGSVLIAGITITLALSSSPRRRSRSPQRGV